MRWKSDSIERSAERNPLCPEQEMMDFVLMYPVLSVLCPARCSNNLPTLGVLPSFVGKVDHDIRIAGEDISLPLGMVVCNVVGHVIHRMVRMSSNPLELHIAGVSLQYLLDEMSDFSYVLVLGFGSPFDVLYRR